LSLHYYPVVYRIAYRMLLSHSDAEDVTQEILLKAWAGLKSFRRDSQFGSWLHSIATKHCYDALRKRKREISRSIDIPIDQLNDDLKLMDLPIDVNPRHSKTDVSLILREAVGRLPEKLASVIMLHYFAHKDLKEVSAILSIPERTAYSRLYEAIRRLRKILEA
jgi:RNA polymerase sigma-70 factor (ECF subfamily)